MSDPTTGDWLDDPAEGSIIADLATLKEYVGARGSADDPNLTKRLYAAREWAYERVYPDDRGHPDVQEAILLLASRLYKRRQTPEGTAGFLGETTVIRMLAGDPDINELIEGHRDFTIAGIA